MNIQVTLRYKGRQYWLIDRYDWPEFETARFQWEINNFGCDCNRSLFIIRQCDWRFPELPCGHSIELVSLVPVEKKQRPLSRRRSSAYMRKRYTQPEDWLKVYRFEEDYKIIRAIIDEWKSQINNCAK